MEGTRNPLKAQTILKRLVVWCGRYRPPILALKAWGREYPPSINWGELLVDAVQW